MYFLKQLEQTVSLPPEYLGAHLDTLVRHHLYTQQEGTCTGAHGYLVAILSIDRIDRARIQEGTGAALFPVTFTALLLKPFRNEVVLAQVASVNKMGFFAQVGPLQVFVSSHLIPGEFGFDALAVPPCYSAVDGKGTGGVKRIGAGDTVRLKIVGTRVDAAEIVAIGSIKEEYLGVVSGAE